MKKKFLWAIACILALLVSCVKFEDTFNYKTQTNSNGEYAIVFSNRSKMTKASVSSVAGTGYDTFSLFAWNSINDTIMKPYSVVADGLNSYQYEDVTGQELKYFKRVADWYDFIGIIPTDHNMTLSNGEVKVEGVKSFVVDDKRAEKAVNLTDTLYWSAGLSADSPEEFLTAYKRVEKADYGNVVNLPFNHQNALIFLGFSSDKTDTRIIDYAPGTPDVPEVPAVNDTVDTWVNLKRSYSAVGSSTKLKGPGETTYTNAAALPDNLVAEIKSYYSINGGTPGDYDLHLGNTVWPSSEIKQLRVVKAIPDEYKITFEMYNSGETMDFFNGWKYLQDNGYDIQPGTTGGKPDVWNYVLIDAFVNGSAYTVVGLNCGDLNAVPQYTINVTPGAPAIPGTPGLEGVRVFSADSLGVNNVPTDTLYCIHVPHTVTADATVSASGTVLSNRVTTDDVIQFSLPSTTTLSETPVWSSSTFYALPGDTNFNFIVVKLSYVYNGVTAYDVRVPIHLPDGGLQPGKYYKYELYITSTSNGTNDPAEATDEKDEIIIEDNPVIQVRLVENGYTQGDERRFTI